MRRVAVLALIALLCLGLASSVLRPPQRFHGDNWAIVEWVGITQVDQRCRELGAMRAENKRFQGCVRDRHMILPNPCPLIGYSADITCHELAHVNGWAHD